jgi:hypothetical protein
MVENAVLMRIYGMVIVVLICTVTPLISAPLTAAIESIERKRFAAVIQYWKWSYYWSADGVDFPLTLYRPSTSFSALVFFNTELVDSYWGFCSKALGVCQSYAALHPAQIGKEDLQHGGRRSPGHVHGL